MSSILIVDDDAQLRQSFEKILTQEGYDVQTAATGEAGLELVKQRVPDLVIMDVRMPVDIRATPDDPMISLSELLATRMGPAAGIIMPPGWMDRWPFSLFRR